MAVRKAEQQNNYTKIVAEGLKFLYENYEKLRLKSDDGFVLSEVSEISVHTPIENGIVPSDHVIYINFNLTEGYCVSLITDVKLEAEMINLFMEKRSIFPDMFYGLSKKLCSELYIEEDMQKRKDYLNVWHDAEIVVPSKPINSLFIKYVKGNTQKKGYGSYDHSLSRFISNDDGLVDNVKAWKFNA